MTLSEEGSKFGGHRGGASKDGGQRLGLTLLAPAVFSELAHDVAVSGHKAGLSSISWPTVAALTNKKIASFASSSADHDITSEKKAGHTGLFLLFLL